MTATITFMFYIKNMKTVNIGKNVVNVSDWYKKKLNGNI